jgi:hypothetical protein
MADFYILAVILIAVGVVIGVTSRALRLPAKARDWDFNWKGFGGGFTWYPYQFAFGFSVRYWPCLHAPSIRIHLGPFKFWCYLVCRRPVRSSD